MDDFKIFISYCWNDKDVVDEIDIFFHSIGVKLIRDVRDLHYKSNIKQFMSKVRSCDYVLMPISEKYLKSKNCMYEVMEFIKDKSYRERILPIILGDTDFFSVDSILKYKKHWDNEYIRIEKELSRYSAAEVEFTDLKIHNEIKSHVYEFLNSIKELNCFSFEIMKELKYAPILKEMGLNNTIENKSTNGSTVSLIIDEDDVKFLKLKVLGIGKESTYILDKLSHMDLEDVDIVFINSSIKPIENHHVGNCINLNSLYNDNLDEDLNVYDKKKIKNILADTDMVIIVTSMNEVSFAHKIAQFSHVLGVLTIGYVTKSFDFEGEKRIAFAETQTQKFLRCVDSLIVLDKNKILKADENIESLLDVLDVISFHLKIVVKSIIELVSLPGIISLEYDDLRNFLADAGIIYVGFGESFSQEGIEKAACQAMYAGLDNISLFNAKSVLLNITGSNSLTLMTIHEATNVIINAIGPKCTIIYGVSIDDSLGERIQVTLLARNVE